MTMVMTFEAFQRWPRLATVKSRTLLTSSVSKIKSHLWGTKTNRDSHSIHTILNQLHQECFSPIVYFGCAEGQIQYFQEMLKK